MGIWMSPEQQQEVKHHQGEDRRLDFDEALGELRNKVQGLRLQLGAQTTHVTALQAAGTQQIENLRLMRAKWERAERLAEMHFEAWNKADMRVREINYELKILKDALADRDKEIRGLVSDFAEANAELEKYRPVAAAD